MSYAVESLANSNFHIPSIIYGNFLLMLPLLVAGLSFFKSLIKEISSFLFMIRVQLFWFIALN